MFKLGDKVLLNSKKETGWEEGINWAVADRLVENKPYEVNYHCDKSISLNNTFRGFDHPKEKFALILGD